MLDDANLLALNCYEEARGEPDDGVAAVAQVVLNRMAHKGPQSDGTISGTILFPNAFSWTMWEMVKAPGSGKLKYTKVARTRAEVEARVDLLYERARRFGKTWDRCFGIAERVRGGDYAGPEFDKLGKWAVLYFNPHIPGLKPPSWADPSKRVCSIGDHDFFRA